jgi:hypothetical protein
MRRSGEALAHRFSDQSNRNQFLFGGTAICAGD